jgi:hypothetical protein
MASRVVPATSLTTSRSSPKMALIREDLPALGFPTTAMRMASEGSSRVPSFRKTGGQFIQKIRDPIPMLGRDRKQCIDAQAVKIGQGFFLAFTVDLVNHIKHGFVHGAQVWIRSASKGEMPPLPSRIKDNGIGVTDGLLHLLADVRGKGVVVPFGKTAGVHQGKGFIVPAGIPEVPVPRHAGQVIHNGIPGSGDPVE